MENFQEMLEQNLNQSQLPETGQLIETTVIQITDQDVVLDVGVKSEARISLSEFKEPPQVGDKIEVYVENSGPNYVKLSFKKAEYQKLYQSIKESFNAGFSVKAKIIEVVKGGVKVLIANEMEAFLPLSQLDIRKVDKPEEYVGKEIEVQVIKFEEKGRRQNMNIVVSRRVLLEAERSEKVEALYEKLEEGSIVDCKVVKINPNSVIVEIEEALTGLIRIGDLSWDRVNKPSDVVELGQFVKAKILEIIKDKNRMLLSIKDLKEDPFVGFSEKHNEGDNVKGEIVKIGDRLVFVKIEEGVEGIIRLKDLTWSKSVKNPKEIVKEHSVVEAKIIGWEKKKVVLGLKQIHGDPWENIEEKFPVGKKLKGKITGKTDFGVFVELEEGIEALLHKNDIDWNLKNIELGNYSVGDEIEGIILKVNKKDRKISMGMKQLFDNPWQNFASENPKWSIVKGKIKEIKDTVLILAFGEEVEGVLPASHLEKKVEVLSEEFKVGDELEVIIIEVNPNKNILKLSIKELERKKKQKELSKYMASQDEEEETNVTFGDLLGKNLDKFKK